MLWCSTTEPQRLCGKRVHMTDVLHTIRINYVYSIMFVNRMREMLCKEIEKDGFCLVMSVGQRKNSESPGGIAPQTFGFLASDALPLSHRDSMVNEVYYKVHMTHILHTTGIRNEHWSPESKGLRFDSSLGLRIVSLSTGTFQMTHSRL